jgi:kynureninase
MIGVCAVAKIAATTHQRRMANITLAEVREWDKQDPLRDFRARFRLPEGMIYLDGNSLGALPAATPARLADTIEREWGEGLIASWHNAGWLDAPARVGGKIARLIGAAPDEVIVADSTSVNLFKLLAAALRLRPGRHKIVLEAGSFPTDRYIAEGIASLLPGIEVVAVPPADLISVADAQTAILLLCDVHYCTGARHDMAALTRAAHDAGALALWDLSHSAGAVPVNLSACAADLAVSCGYKFLNGGPGAPAFLFVARRLQADAYSPLQGWIGHTAPFAFAEHYAAAAGMQRFLAGTPGMLGLAALESGVDLFLTADQVLLWAKSALLFDLFAELAAAWCPELHLLTPSVSHHRGSHIAFRHPSAPAIMRDLIARGVVGDYRPPEMLRFGLTPLYTSFEDIWRSVDALRGCGFV